MRVLLIACALATLATAGCSNAPEQADAPVTEASRNVALDATGSRLTALEDWIRGEFGQYGRLGYRAAETDLDGDGTPEVLVYIGGPALCGTGGCDLVVLKRDGDGFAKVTETTVTQLPLGVLDSESNGWSDLWVTVAGGGELTGRRMLRFDGNSYPSNPTVVPDGQVDVLNPLTLIDDGELIWLD